MAASLNPSDVSNSTGCFPNIITCDYNNFYYSHLVDEKTEYLTKLAKARYRSVWP